MLQTVEAAVVLHSVEMTAAVALLQNRTAVLLNKPSTL
jgi:hypothetical protein